MSPKTLSHHLGHLRTAGLVFCEQSGRCKWYEAAAGRVRYQRQGPGRFSLTVTARGGDVAVTLTAGVAEPPRAETAKSEVSHE